MNGLQIIDLKEASFMDRLLRREPRENAFVEINNLLACVPILRLDREAINSCLRKYAVPHEKARSRLLNIYSIILRHFLIDADLGDRELEKLHHLRHILMLDDKEVGSIHKNLVQPVFKAHVRRAISDGELTPEQKAGLEKIAERLYIPKEFARKLYINEASRFLHSVLKESISDGMLSDAEEAELKRLASNLQVELKFSENARRNLDRCRYLWRLYKGELPTVRVPVRLRPDENCSAFVGAEHFDVSSTSRPVKYSGYSATAGQHGIGFHSGVFQYDRVTGKVIAFVDRGTLYFTDLRLLFIGSRGRNYFLYHNLVGGTFYRNGLLIEQKRGRDQFFRFDSGDMPAIKLIFDSLMTRSRR